MAVEMSALGGLLNPQFTLAPTSEEKNLIGGDYVRIYGCFCCCGGGRRELLEGLKRRIEYFSPGTIPLKGPNGTVLLAECVPEVEEVLIQKEREKFKKIVKEAFHRMIWDEAYRSKKILPKELRLVSPPVPLELPGVQVEKKDKTIELFDIKKIRENLPNFVKSAGLEEKFLQNVVVSIQEMTRNQATRMISSQKILEIVVSYMKGLPSHPGALVQPGLCRSVLYYDSLSQIQCLMRQRGQDFSQLSAKKLDSEKKSDPDVFGKILELLQNPTP